MRRNDRAESNTEFSPMSHVFTLYLYPDDKSYRWCSILGTMVGFAEEFEEHGPGPGAVLRELYMTGIRFDTVECEEVAVFLHDAVEIESLDEDDWCASRRVKSWGRADDLERRSFSFEISLVALLATGEPALLRQMDGYAGFFGIDRTGTECRWDGYERLRDGLLAYLEAGPEGAAPRCSRSNLESAIIAWNKERGPDPNRLAEYLAEHRIEVLEKYRCFFPTICPPPRGRKTERRRNHVQQ